MIRLTFCCLVVFYLIGCGGSSSPAPIPAAPISDQPQNTDPEVTTPENGTPAVPLMPTAPSTMTTPTNPGSTSIADTRDSNFYFTGNNSALLQGELFGQGQVDNALLRTALDFSINIPNENIEVRAAYLVRFFLSVGSGNLSDEGIVISVVRNVSDEFVCSIDFDDLVLTDSAGTVLDTSGNSRATGSQGVIFGRNFDSCAAPAEDIYIISDSLRGDFDTASRLTIGSVDDTIVGEPATPGFVATAYSLDSETGAMKINVPNYRETDFWSAFLGDIVVLDDTGLPLAYTSIADTPSSFEGNVAPGDVGVITANGFFRQGSEENSFLGSASALRITFRSR